ncbi:hypothetical protein Astex_3712 (plasmid) [Asticcacaulis excentricus CB 48]|uniref:Uncharacterized protein n=1 Tax=Asticcacaulis excentricus (strain ATCC 15261 / DSM 4724 / KCTC 12464 / NCIMB 9791 / VKM B-1370 / CB 48) TaxID=573065 RepID=E8RVR0_ASTEC|nr:hypothetical protein Astex_3712 [Asticcacaulis excentricus CB 48]
MPIGHSGTQTFPQLMYPDTAESTRQALTSPDAIWPLGSVDTSQPSFGEMARYPVDTAIGMGAELFGGALEGAFNGNLSGVPSALSTGNAGSRMVASELAIAEARLAGQAARAGGATTGTAGALVTREGQVFTGLSTGAGGGATNPTLTQALNDIARSQSVKPFHGQCCEVSALNAALNAGANPAGGTMAATRITGGGRGALLQPCPTCSALQSRWRRCPQILSTFEFAPAVGFAEIGVGASVGGRRGAAH